MHPPDPEPFFVARSSAMRDAIALATNLRGDWRGVLIVGAAATGKDAMADLVLRRSPRSDEPIFRIDCRTLDYERSLDPLAVPLSFTCTTACTVVLNDIDRLSPTSAARLHSRMWHGPWVMAQGVRFVAMSRRTREHLAARSDAFSGLLEHINDVDIRVPSLRRRRADLPWLVRQRMAQLCREEQVAELGIAVEVIDVFRDYRWPGNLRELDETLAWALLAARGRGRDEITVEDLPSDVRGEVDHDGDDMEHHDEPREEPPTPREIEEREILCALETHGGRREDTAEELGISVTTLRRRLRELGLVRKYRAAR